MRGPVTIEKCTKQPLFPFPLPPSTQFIKEHSEAPLAAHHVSVNAQALHSTSRRTWVNEGMCLPQTGDGTAARALRPRGELTCPEGLAAQRREVRRCRRWRRESTRWLAGGAGRGEVGQAKPEDEI